MITIRGLNVRIDRRGISPLDQHGVIEVDQLRLEPSAADRTWFSTISNFTVRSIQMYSMYEAFARERMREQLERSASQRLSADLASARRWQRLASFSARRAARSARRLAAYSSADYQLVA